ncbi:MAG: DUF2442 domain-containing protein [Flavobacteriales bacterium]|nr:DUF2442 domain-containing protein [Flavobacteriales bacterium]
MKKQTLPQDPVSALIRQGGLSIKQVIANRDAGALIIFMNKGGAFNFPLSTFKRLAKGKQADLDKWELLPDGSGVHWPKLDEHLSLRGFMLAALSQMAKADVSALPGVLSTSKRKAVA